MVNYGLKSLRYLAPKIWDIIPLENSGSLAEFITNKSGYLSTGVVMSNLYPSYRLYRLSVIIEICFRKVYINSPILGQHSSFPKSV